MAIGYLQINGSGPRNAAVGVFDKDDNLIVECQSDARGFWSVASVPMEVGAYQLRAKMRAEDGREHISNLIDVTVDDPDSDVEIEAEVLDPEMVAVMQELDLEEQVKAATRAAFVAYDDLVAQAANNMDVPTWRLSAVLNATRGNLEDFWSEVGERRQKQKYARIVCIVAAGGQLDERDQQSIWVEFKKTEEEFSSSVDRARRAAGAGWNSSLDTV